jgi:hypothetical protein
MLVKISAKQLGKKSPIFENQEIELNLDATSTSVSDFLAAVVDAQVKKFQSASFEKEDEDKTHAALNNYLSDLLSTGKAGFGALYNLNPVDIQKAKQHAIQAFEDGIFALFQGEEQIDINSTIDLTKNEPFVFIRLTFLTGSYW